MKRYLLSDLFPDEMEKSKKFISSLASLGLCTSFVWKRYNHMSIMKLVPDNEVIIQIFPHPRLFSETLVNGVTYQSPEYNYVIYYPGFEQPLLAATQFRGSGYDYYILPFKNKEVNNFILLSNIFPGKTRRLRKKKIKRYEVKLCDSEGNVLDKTSKPYRSICKDWNNFFTNLRIYVSGLGRLKKSSQNDLRIVSLHNKILSRRWKKERKKEKSRNKPEPAPKPASPLDLSLDQFLMGIKKRNRLYSDLQKIFKPKIIKSE